MKDMMHHYIHLLWSKVSYWIFRHTFAADPPSMVISTNNLDRPIDTIFSYLDLCLGLGQHRSYKISVKQSPLGPFLIHMSNILIYVGSCAKKALMLDI